MPINVSGRNYMLDQLGTQLTYVALYTDNGATTEVTGGSYARQSITWSAASAGSKAISNQPVFQVPAGTTVRAVGFMTAVSGGTQYAMYDVVDEAFAANGTYTITSASISAT
jgi:hypothetical protein